MVEADGPSRLAKEIRNAISEGWQPLGGVIHWYSWFYHAVVKYEEVEKCKEEEEHCGSCRWFKYSYSGPTGWCCALPNKVERHSYEPCCSLYAHKDQQKNEEIKGVEE